jgi:hypothetical protein
MPPPVVFASQPITLSLSLMYAADSCRADAASSPPAAAFQAGAAALRQPPLFFCLFSHIIYFAIATFIIIECYFHIGFQLHG